MLIIKSIYFNLLAIQISFIKLIKKIYFATNFYNKSLISKTPQQFYFHPNPFLLATITNYKKFSFKIDEIDPNIFWIKQKSKKEQQPCTGERITDKRCNIRILKWRCYSLKLFESA